jgi:hypothetical protein
MFGAIGRVSRHVFAGAFSPSPCTQGEGRGEGCFGLPSDARQSKGDPHPKEPRKNNLSNLLLPFLAVSG